MKEKTKCDFCGCNEGCFGELPGPDGRCMGFFVPKELAEAYRVFVCDKYADDVISSILYAISVLDAFDSSDICCLKPVISHHFLRFFKHFESLSTNKEVSSDA